VEGGVAVFLYHGYVRRVKFYLHRVIHKSLRNFKLGCATTKRDTADRSISIGRESLQVLYVTGAVAYLQVSLLGAVVTKHVVDRV